MVVNYDRTKSKTMCGKCKKQVSSIAKRSLGWKFNHTFQKWFCKACIYRMRGKVVAV